MMFETSKHVPKIEKRCCVFKNIYNTCAIKTNLVVQFIKIIITCIQSFYL